LEKKTLQGRMLQMEGVGEKEEEDFQNLDELRPLHSDMDSDCIPPVESSFALAITTKALASIVYGRVDLILFGHKHEMKQ
jgi:hypothetical protein